MDKKNGSATVEELADCVVNNPGLVMQLQALGFKSGNPNGMTFKEAMICSQIANAVKGDSTSFRAIMGTMKDQKKKSPLEELASGNVGGNIDSLL